MSDYVVKIKAVLGVVLVNLSPLEITFYLGNPDVCYSMTFIVPQFSVKKMLFCIFLNKFSSLETNSFVRILSNGLEIFLQEFNRKKVLIVIFLLEM